jgi:hypothetical protein
VKDVTYSEINVTGKFPNCPTFVLKNYSITNKKLNTMGNLLYIIAVILVIAWLVGLVGFNAGGIIHVLLVIAVIAVILRLIQGRGV